MVYQIFGGLRAFVDAVMFDRCASCDGALALVFGLALLATPAILMVRETPETVGAG